MSKNNISFILHKPQLSENIGACARAMKNFNFSKLVVIDPKPTFPNDKILATSVGAKEVIKKAKLFNNFESSLSDFDFLIATSSRFRNKNIKHISLNDLNRIDFNKSFDTVWCFKNFNPYKVKIKNKKIGVKIPNSFKRKPDMYDPNLPKKF